MAAKFAPVLRCNEKGVLKAGKYLSASIFIPPCPKSDFFVNNPGRTFQGTYFKRKVFNGI
ncbi:hypothetical protein [Fodinibius roseus]|uniref:hypothetical protein n=1 Tax=Fodinibius roseus TaxID=1194090 RepID=UPI00147C553D|nr:hypothetical protein [Fodinibius roseus]